MKSNQSSKASAEAEAVEKALSFFSERDGVRKRASFRD
jgi:hypothetical protein